MSRSKKSIKNIFFNMINIFISLVFMFLVRTVFINVLGIEYLGLNGVFQNIFQFLSLAELGIGSAISFRLYKPLNENDYSRITALMTFFKKSYQIISLIIIVMSLSLLPFLSNIVGSDINGLSIYLIYFIYMLQTLSSYMFFAYKMILLKADQREYVIAKYNNYTIVISSLLEIIILLIYQSFIGYLIVLVFSNIIKNIFISRKVNLDYPYLSQNDSIIEKKELYILLKDFLSSFLYRINSVIITSTDNLILTYYIGLSIVGLYSNYLLITNTVARFLNPILQSIKASLGSFIAQKSNMESYHLFKSINILTVIIYGGAGTLIFILSNRFIDVWIGQEFLLSRTFVILIASDFYLRGLQLFVGQIRNAMGLFQELKLRPIFSMATNLFLSIYLVNYYGIEGVIFATVISNLLTTLVIDPVVIHKIGFNQNFIIYFLKNIYYSIIVVLAAYISYILTINIENSVQGLLYSFITTVVVISIFYSLGFGYLKECKYLMAKIISTAKITK